MSIVLEDLTKRYGGHPVVSSVSLEVGDGELFVLLGSSGSGKSTLLRMIAGLSEVDAGRVLLRGRDVTGLPPAARGVGFGFQSYGRLLEVGPPDELYLRPETEFVATFLGTANLMVGEATAEGVRLGPVQFPLGTKAEPADGARRVQVLFRPEDVAVRDSADGLACPLLGRAVVEQRSFVGSFERLRLRLPPLPGVRAIAPPVPFGRDEVWIEATRPQDLARRFPLRPGDSTFVGVQRVHALVHPGLRFLLLTNGSARSRAALALGGELARRAHPRVPVLGPAAAAGGGERALQEAREALGGGLAALETRLTAEPPAEAVAEEVSRRPCDLVILSLPSRDGVEMAEEVLAAGQHHLLLAPAEGAPGVPARPLICVAVGETGTEDVSFSGRPAR